MDFLAENNVCGQTLLRLVSRGSAIITELLRLSSHVPPVFKLEAMTNKADVEKYSAVVIDFRYLKASAVYESRIENSAALLDFDAEFRDTYLVILKRFYQLFESVYKYAKDLSQYLKDIEAGVFIEQTLPSILLNDDGKQLLTEAFYLYGTMLLMMENKLDGVVRERLLVAYLRYLGHAESPLLDDVMALCAATGYSPGAPHRRPADYPESLFARFALPVDAVAMILDRLRSDDVYVQIRAYPLPEHRSAALAMQAAMVYVVLYFAPSVLRDESAMMREIVDKHFPDNFVVSYYLGHAVDLTTVWAPYRAASAALANTIDAANVERLRKRYFAKLPAQLQATAELAREGVLDDDYVLDHTERLLNCIRESNVCVRWLLLHLHAEDARLRAACTANLDLRALFALLLDTSQLEYVLKQKFERLLGDKAARWQTLRADAAERVRELGEYFSGEKALTRVKRNEHLMKWFTELSAKIAELDYVDSTLAGRKIQHLIEALEEVEQYWQIEASLQVVQFLQDTRRQLRQMIRTVNIKEEVMVVLGIVTDIDYGWRLISRFLPLMHDAIKRNPASVIKLRSVFLKLSAAIEAPLLRINQAGSKDLYSVSEYHSSRLVKFVRTVLEIVPRSMFALLKDIISLTTTRIRELLAKIDRNDLRDVAQLDERRALAKLTYDVSEFTNGILAMETTLYGVIQVDPKQLLEDGIRKELVTQLAKALDAILVFGAAAYGANDVSPAAASAAARDFEQRLRSLAQVLDGFRRAFQYIADYVNVPGLRIWQEEFARVVNFNAQMETNSFLKVEIAEWQSAYQSETIPIPTFPPRDRSINFVGRLARALLAQTATSRTVYLEPMSSWWSRAGAEVVGIRTFTLIFAAIDAYGLAALDRLYCFMIVHSLQSFVARVRHALAKDRVAAPLLADVARALTPTNALPRDAAATYAGAFKRLAPTLAALRDAIGVVGQMQLLRRQIANVLNFNAKLDCAQLVHTLQTLNSAVLGDVRRHYRAPDRYAYPKEDNPLMEELGDYVERVGISDPLTKIYLTTEPLEHAPLVLFLVVAAALKDFEFDASLGVLMARRAKKAYDQTPLIVGVATVLKQFHSQHTHSFMSYVGQYVKSFVNSALAAGEAKKKARDLASFPIEVENTLHFIRQLSVYNDSRQLWDAYLPAFLLDQQ